MALVRRISRLFGADINAVLDRLEDPEALLSLAIQEMEDELQHERADLAALRRELETLRARREKLMSSRAAVDSELDLCFEAGNEGLAKSMTRRKLQLTKLIESVAARLDDTEAAIRDGESRLGENETRLNELQQQVELFIDSGSSKQAPADDFTDLAITADEIEVAYLREKQKRSQS